MKTNIKQILSISSLAIIAALSVVSCKDEVLVPVRDNTANDSLANLINILDEQKITLDKKINKITITNAILNDSANSLSNSVNNNKTVEYTINLINAGTTITNGRTKGVDGVSVTVIQNGKSTNVISASGRAIFTGLIQGTAQVQISATGYASITSSVYLQNDNNGTYGDGAVRAASSNFFMIPIGGTSGITISGKLYINTNILDDTLGRQYTKTGDPLYLKYISNPSIWNQYNYSGYNFGNQQTIYGSTLGSSTVTKFDPLTSGSTVYAYPNMSSSYSPANNSDMGYIMSVSYTGLVSYATVDASGAYSISVPYVLNGANGNIGYSIYADPIDATLTRFNGNGTTQDVGSVKTTFKSFNTTTYVTTSIDRYVIKENWNYRSAVTVTGGYDVFGSNYLYGEYTTPGATLTSNIFYFPYSRN